MDKKLRFKPIYVSSDKLIIDGHHRYISSVLTNFDLDVVSDYPKPTLVNQYDWNSVEFIEKDWDSPSKIDMLNEEDARYNGMDIEDVKRIIE